MRQLELPYTSIAFTLGYNEPTLNGTSPQHVLILNFIGMIDINP
ncbi:MULTISPECIES: hypothetical protein [Leptospira]|nr:MULTISPECIES: hypothetical protein [Leptospira]